MFNANIVSETRSPGVMEGSSSHLAGEYGLEVGDVEAVEVEEMEIEVEERPGAEGPGTEGPKGGCFEEGCPEEEASTSTAGLDRDLLFYRENASAHNLYLSLKKVTGNGSVMTTASLDDMSGLPSESSSVRSSSSPSGGGLSDPDDVDYSVLDRYGFIVLKQKGGGGDRSESDDKTLKEKQERQGRKEARRAIKWVDMLKTLEQIAERRDWHKAHRKFEGRLVKGIPECLRMKMWALFVGVPPVLSSSPTPAYRELYLKISGFERQIDLDIERTLRDHILFKARFSSAQVSLFKILVAYSNHDPEVGYCQGMSTVAAFLLLYFEEEMAFNMLKRLMDRDGLRGLFTAGFPLLFETFYVQEQLMKQFMPALYARLESLHITSSVYATKWYLTLFLGFPFSLATRVWDLFLFWGMDILICASLALLKMHEHYLLTLGYESCMQFLSKLPETPIDEMRLVRTTWLIWRRIYPHYAERDERKCPFQTLRLQYGKLSAKKT